MYFKFYNKNSGQECYYFDDSGVSLLDILSKKNFYYKFSFYRTEKIKSYQEDHLLIVRSTINSNLQLKIVFSLFLSDGRVNKPELNNLPIDSFILESKPVFKKFKYVSLI